MNTERDWLPVGVALHRPQNVQMFRNEVVVDSEMVKGIQNILTNGIRGIADPLRHFRRKEKSLATVWVIWFNNGITSIALR